MPSRKDLILGRIMIERSLVTEQQLEECFQAQLVSPADPNATLGTSNTRPLVNVALERGYIKQAVAAELLEEQLRRLRIIENHEKMARGELALGQLLVRNKKATQIQINKCLEIQQRMAQQGKSPVPRLGELLIEHGYVDARTIQDLLRQQKKDLLICTKCGRSYNVIGVDPARTYKCTSCGGTLQTREMLDSIGAQETIFDFELPSLPPSKPPPQP